MELFLPSQNNEAQVGVVSRVHDTGADVAIVHMQDGTPWRILTTSSVALARADRTHEARKVRVLRALTEATEAALAHYGATHFAEHGPVERSYAIMHSPWMRGHVLQSTASYTDERTIQKEDVNELVRALVAQQEALHGSTLMNLRVLGLELNGYTVPALPPDAHARSVKVSVLAHESDADFLTSVNERLRMLVPLASAQIYGATAIASLYAHDSVPDYVHLTITPERSVIALVRGKTLAATAELPHGVDSLASHESYAHSLAQTLQAMRLGLVHPVLVWGGDSSLIGRVSRIAAHPALSTVTRGHVPFAVHAHERSGAANIMDTTGESDAQLLAACSLVYNSLAGTDDLLV